MTNLSWQLHERAVWAIRDLVHHYGEHHPSVGGTAAGHSIAALGSAVPALAGVVGQPATLSEQLGDVFQRYGWTDVPVTLDSVLDLADCLMNPDGDVGAFLAKRRQLRLASTTSGAKVAKTRAAGPERRRRA